MNIKIKSVLAIITTIVMFMVTFYIFLLAGDHNTYWGEGRFECDNGRDIRGSQVNDGNDYDCGSYSGKIARDKSDERPGAEDQIVFGPPNMWLMWLLPSLILLVILGIWSFRLIKEASADAQEVQRHIEVVLRDNNIQRAKDYEEHLDYEEAIKLYDEEGKPEEAARVRKIVVEQKAVNQTVIQGDYVDDRDTIVKDSVINRSNIGGGSSKMQELKELKEMRDSGDISDEEYEKMKREIIG